MTSPVLELRLSRACRNGFCLEDLELELGEGELLVVTGPSGSGKTTLARLVAGLHEGVFEGCLRILGLDPYREHMPPGVLVYVPQEPWRLPIAPTPLHEALLHTNSLEEAVRLLSRLGLEEQADNPTPLLSMGQLQRLALLPLVALKPRLLVLDEPTVYLDEQARRLLVSLVEEKLMEGAAVLVVDHDPWRWRKLNPRLLVLDHGKPVCQGGLDECGSHPALEKGDELRRPASPKEDLVLSLEGVWFRYPGSRGWVLRGVTLRVHGGELLAVYGPNGSGKTTLLKLAAGIYKPQRGHVTRRGRAVYVPENPLLLFTGATVYEEVVGAAHDPSWAEEVLRRLGLWRLRSQPIARLSLGERRRLAVASALASDAALLALDEPMGGLDPAAARSLLNLLVEYADTGRAVVAAAHDKRLLAAATRSLKLG